MAILPIYKDIIDLIKKGSTIEAQEKIMEFREAALSLQEENIKLKEKIKKLEAELNKQKEVIWEAPYYWVVGDQSKAGPFCQNCYDKSKELIAFKEMVKAIGSVNLAKIHLPTIPILLHQFFCGLKYKLEVHHAKRN